MDKKEYAVVLVERVQKLNSEIETLITGKADMHTIAGYVALGFMKDAADKLEIALEWLRGDNGPDAS